MKKIRLLVLAVSSLFVISMAHAVDFSDIQLWAGTGANEAAMVIDWNDGKSDESLVWGYRWDGSATGADMFEAIVSADPRLFAHLGTFDFGSGPKPIVFGIGYDLNGNGAFGVSASPPLSFGAGGLTIDSLATGAANADDLGTPTEAADHWLEGWNSGFWGYYVKPDAASAWDSSAVGFADRVLTDGAWDGYSFAPGFADSDPSEPGIAPVPEPGTLAFCLVGGVLLCNRLWQNRRKIHAMIAGS